MRCLATMKIKKIEDKRQFFLLSLTFITLFLSYSVNLWHISADSFHTFERSPEGLVIGKMARSQRDGIFAYGGLTGINKVSLAWGDYADMYRASLAAQHDFYLTQKELPDEYIAYKSQPGGQSILYSSMQNIIPGDNYFKLKIIRGINAALTAICFTLFIGWVYRNCGFGSSVVTALLVLLSPWLNNFGHNLWWSFWNFYIPFLTMLLLLERNHKKPGCYSDLKILMALFAAMFAKCFFSGYEYITTVLLSAICPFVYYTIIENENFLYFIRISIKAGLSMVLGVVVSMLFLVIQIGSLNGSVNEGVQHIIQSYTKRSTITEVAVSENIIGTSFTDIFSAYFEGNAFGLGFLPDSFRCGFGLLVVIICLFAAFIYLTGRNKDSGRANIALLSTTLFSLLCPLSWFIIFKQHAASHPHIDYIVWYIPFLVYGFAVIGQGCESTLKQLFKKKHL